MNILNDFFFLSWQMKPISSPVDTYDSLAELLANRHDDFCDASSILLVISEGNFAEMSQLKEPKDAIEFFIGSSDWSGDTVQVVQYQLLSFLNLLGDLSLNKKISKRLDRIRKSAIVGYESSRKLISLLSLIKEKKDEQKIVTLKRMDEDNTFYQSGVFAIKEQIEALSNNVEDMELLSRAKEIANRLDKQKFSIGITGVMNAGKST
ncbi:MAG TPA: dynamin, partial [Sulfurovum sp.]|nr:dynamin [Sulfurovum sp.]